MAVRVKQTDQPVDTEVLAEAIVAIAAGMRKLMQTRLSERTLCMLIADATPRIGRTNPPRYVSAKEVKAVLQGLADLEKVHLKKVK